MQIRKVLHLTGPNIWANYPVIEAWVELGALDTQPSNTLPGFNERLMAWLPSMIEHRCSEGVRGGFFSRLREGTWMGHVLEHVSLELQTLAHLPVGYGRTRETSERGTYRVVVECQDPVFAEACLRTGRELLLAAIEDHPFDVPAHLRGLRELGERLCLAPFTQAIVNAAKARLIPSLRVPQGNLVQLGYGKAQRRMGPTETARTCALSESIAQDAELTRERRDAVGVRTPAGREAEIREEAIVEHLFPPGASGRVPLVAVSGTNGKTSVASFIEAMLTSATSTVGYAGSNGLRVGSRVLDPGDCTDIASARRLLMNPSVDDMVIETSEIGVLREGIAFDRCQVAVITNLGSCDHMGERYVDNPDFIGRAVRTPLDVVPPDGFAVLNADEPEVAAMAQKCRGAVIYFSRDPASPLVREHLSSGGRVVCLSDDAILALHGGQRQRLLDLSAFRSQPFGLPWFTVDNLLAAAGAGLALDLPSDRIRRGLESSPRHLDDAFYAAGDQRALITRARNPSALAAWLSVLEADSPARRRIAAIEIPWDWREDDAAEMGKILRAGFSQLCLTPENGSRQAMQMCKIIKHNSLTKETAWPSALERICSWAGSSDLLFIAPCTRAGINQANEHCKKRNMARLS